MRCSRSTLHPSDIKRNNVRNFYCHRATTPCGPGPPHFRGFTITFRHITFGRTPLDEWSARCRDIYLTTCNTQKKQTSMRPTGFESAIPVSEGQQNYTLARTDTQHSKPTFVWVHIADKCGYIQSDMRVHTYSYNATTLHSYVHCSRCLTRLSARKKLTLLTPDSRGK